MTVDNMIRPPTALELLGKVHPLPPGGGGRIEPKSTDLSKVVPKPSQTETVAEIQVPKNILPKNVPLMHEYPNRI
jgi:hypothetical protein